MKKLILLHISLLLLVLGAVPQAFAATVAEASIGNAVSTVGKYDISDMTKEEQEWFITFLEGNFFADGWEQISSDILLSTMEQERNLMQTKLHELGFKIGSEWCKDNDTRKIHTSMLKKWGRELRYTASETPHLLTEVIHRINEEVDELIN